jgi:hypothetical protein
VAYVPALAGFKGWVRVLCIGVSVLPFASLAGLVRTVNALSPKTWSAITRVDSDGYQPFLAPLVVGEVLFYVLMFLLCVHVAILFWTKRRSFPLLFVIATVYALVGIPTDHFLAADLLHRTTTQQPMNFESYASSLAWVAYVLYSKRVKATFLPEPAESPLSEQDHSELQDAV